MLKKNEIKIIFRSELSHFLNDFGFKFKEIADGEVFFHYNDFGFNSIFYRLTSSNRITLGISKRMDEIENMINIFLKQYQKPFSNLDSTLLSALSLIKKLKPPIIETEIISERIANEVLNELKIDIINYAFPFFEKYSALPALDWLFNNYKDIYPDMFFGDPIFRFKRMIVAKLCNNPQYEIISEEVRQLCERSAAKKNGMDYYPSLWQDIYDHLKTVEPKYDYLKEM